jgi:threonine dehydratase
MRQQLASPVAVGLDGCRAGWIAVVASGEGDRLVRTDIRLFDDNDHVIRWRHVQPVQPIVAVDMPIGLPPRVGFRACDHEARARLASPRRSAVFQPPDRELLEAIRAVPYPTYRHAQAFVAERRAREGGTGVRLRGLTRQAFFLIDKLGGIDRALREEPTRSDWLIEFHPEVSFIEMSGEAMPPKRRREGKLLRMEALSRRFPDIPEMLHAQLPWTRRQVELDDVLDAYAGLWTALRFRDRRHHELGGGERDACGLPMRIVV